MASTRVSARLCSSMYTQHWVISNCTYTSFALCICMHTSVCMYAWLCTLWRENAGMSFLQLTIFFVVCQAVLLPPSQHGAPVSSPSRTSRHSLCLPVPTLCFVASVSPAFYLFSLSDFYLLLYPCAVCIRMYFPTLYLLPSHRIRTPSEKEKIFLCLEASSLVCTDDVSTQVGVCIYTGASSGERGKTSAAFWFEVYLRTQV